MERTFALVGVLVGWAAFAMMISIILTQPLCSPNGCLNDILGIQVHLNSV